MKKFLETLIAQKEARMNEIKSLIEKAETVEEVRSLGTEKENVEKEINEARTQLSKVEAPVNPMATYGQRGVENDNLEARMNFAKFVTGKVEKRDSHAYTYLTDVSAAVPENLLNEIISKIEDYGQILPLLTKTAYPVGQTIAVDGAKPSASWVSEGAGSYKQKKELGSLVFGAFKLRCEIAFSQEVSVQTLPAFEALFVRQISEAMAKAIEAKVVSADDGSDCPTGILYRASGSDPTVNINKLATGHFDFKVLCDAEALLPQPYEANAKWFMSKKTFMNIYALTDSNGQPIGRINYGINGKPERFLLGREVIVNPYVADYTEASASADAVVAFLFDPAYYCLNTSYDLGIQRKQDWDNENHYVKGVMSVDGKVLDRESLVKVVKKYN